MRPSVKISACMIVGDIFNMESDYTLDLKRCLDSIHEFVDEIVLVQTDDRDIKSVLSKYSKVKYYHKLYTRETWNFSEARNYSIKRAKYQRILIIDTDEELVEGEQLRQYCCLDEDLVMVWITNFMISSKSLLSSARIFTNGIAQYKDKVHNQLVYDSEKVKVAGCPLTINHYGYALSDEEMNIKFDRTETLLRSQLEENPDNLFAWMNLVRVFRCRNDYEKVLDIGSQVMSKKFTQKNEQLTHQIVTDVEFAMMTVGQNLINNGDNKGLEVIKEAYNMCREVVIQYPYSIDAWYYLGHCALMNGDTNGAIIGMSMYMNLMVGIKNNTTGVVYESYGSQETALAVMFLARKMNSRWLRIPSGR